MRAKGQAVMTYELERPPDKWPSSHLTHTLTLPAALRAQLRHLKKFCGDVVVWCVYFHYPK